MFGKNILLLFFSIFFLVCSQQLTKTANNYGSYNIQYLDYGDCKGPKAKNATLMTTNMVDGYIGIINFTFLADTKLEEIRINVYSLVDNKKNFLWNYKLNDPCKHFSVSFIIQRFLKSDNNCLIKKGFYNCEMNYKEVTVSLIGSSFFYGNYSFKTVIMSKKANIGCFTTSLIITKKT